MEVILQNNINPEGIKIINNIQFTNRELDVIACILGGRATKKIASLLNISVKTAENHIHNIMLKIGCSSRERVIDFVEKSEKFSAIKKYYSNLLIKVTFETKLKKIATSTTSGKPISLIIYYKEPKKDTLISQLEKHLSLAGIQVCSEVWQNKQINIHNDTQLVNYVIYNISQELMQCLGKKESNTNNLHHLIISNQCCTILLGSKDNTTLQEISNKFSNIICVYLEEYENYYFLVFEILKRLLGYDLTQVIKEFKKQYKIFLDYSYLQQNAIEDDFLEKELADNINSIPCSRKSFFSRKKLSIILLTLISCIGFVLNVKNFMTLNFKEDKQTAFKNIINEPLIAPLKTWPLQLPIHDNSRFINRKINHTDCMETIHDILKPQDEQSRILAIYGLGGVGKTQIARHYIHSKLASTSYHFRAWFAAEDKETLTRSYLDFARALGLSKIYSNSVEDIRGVVLHWLEEHPNWLIVFDNVIDYANIQPFLPRTGGNILITSRHAVWPTTIKTLQVTPMQKDEAIRLVRIVSGHRSAQDLTLIKKLGYLPLAIAQAASYMQVYGKTAEDYLRLYARCKQDLLNKDLREYGMEHEPITVTWNNSLNAMEKVSTTHGNKLLAKDFLLMSAYLAPEQIPITILTQWIKQTKPNKDIELVADEILAKLLSHSLISKEKSSKNVNVHRLLQATIREQNRRSGAEQAIITNVMDILVQIFTKNTIAFSDLQTNYNLLPHIDIILKHANKYLHDKHIKLQVARLLNVKAYTYTRIGMIFNKQALEFSNLAKKYCQEIANIQQHTFLIKSKEQLPNKAKLLAVPLYAKLSHAELLPQDKKLLPIIYASILYTNANIYFFNKDPARLRATKLQLYLCKELSKLIGKHSGEKIFYEILAESGGLLHFSLEPGSSKTTLLSNIARYKKLLQRKGIYTNEDGQTINIRNDQIYKMLCLWNTLKNYILLAKHDKNKATEGESVIEELLKQISIYGPNKIASIASYYNDIGNFFLSYENNQKAKIYFEQAINLELTRYSTERTVNHYLADAYYGLANANFNAKNLAAANVAIEHCLQIRQILYGERDGRLIETKQFKNKIDSLLHNQPRITICRKVLKMFGQ